MIIWENLVAAWQSIWSTKLRSGLTVLSIVIGVAAVVFVRGKKPEMETIEIAKSKKIPILRTRIPMFESCGRLWQAGLRGRSNYNRKR